MENNSSHDDIYPKKEGYYEVELQGSTCNKLVCYFTGVNWLIPKTYSRVPNDKIISFKWTIATEFENTLVIKSDNPLKGKKESTGKQHVEYDWDFLKSQMSRLGKYKIENGGKYEYENWKKKIDIKELKKALLRHTLAIMDDVYLDEGEEFGHLNAIALNSMFIFTQLNK